MTRDEVLQRIEAATEILVFVELSHDDGYSLAISREQAIEMIRESTHIERFPRVDFDKGTLYLN